MKKNILFLLLLLPTCLKASTILGTPKVWTVPAIFTGDEKVTFYYDVTDVGFPEGVDLYLWAWQPTEPDAGNGNNSSDFAKLTYLGNNIYCKTMVPTQYFGVDKSAFEDPNWPGFWQQVKTKEDNLWSAVYCAPDNRGEIKDFKDAAVGIKWYSGSNHVYTDKFTGDKPTSVLFNGDLYKLGDRTLNEIAKDADFVQFGTHSGLVGITEDGSEMSWNPMQGLDVWRPLCLQKTGLKNIGNGIWKWDLTTPQEYYSYNWGDGSDPATTPKNATIFGIQNGPNKVDLNTDNISAYTIQAINYLVIKVIKDAKGANQWGVNSGDQVQKAGTAEVYPDPLFSYFPSKVSALDILTFIRQYNGRMDGELTWTITAGDKTISGVMEGSRDKRQGSVNLLSALEKSTASSIKVVIKNAKGVVVVDTEIPLVPLTEVE